MKKVTISLFVLAVVMVFAAGSANAFNIFDQGMSAGLIRQGVLAASQLGVGASVHVLASDGTVADPSFGDGNALAGSLVNTARGIVTDGATGYTVAETDSAMSAFADATSNNSGASVTSAAAALGNNGVLVNSSTGVSGISFGWNDWQLL